MTSRQSPALIGITAAVIAAGLGVGGVLIYNALQDTDEVVGESVAVGADPTVPPAPATSEPVFEPTVPPAPTSDSAFPAADDPTPAPEPTATPVPDADPVDLGAVVTDAGIAAAIAQVESEPLPERLPSRDEAATTRLVADLQRAGHDLGGMDLAIFPASSTDSLLLIETDDSTALLTSDAGEQFILDLLGAPAVVESGTERLVLRHDTVDEQGPLTLTMTVLIADFQNAAATGGDALSLFAVQVDRP